MNTNNTLPTGVWELDASASTVTVTAKKLLVLTVPATLDVVSGTIEIDDDHQVAIVEIVADARSYASTNPKRNEHVRSDDFLDAANHPTIVFRSSSVVPAVDGYRSTGTVTIKGATSPVEVAISDVEFNDGSGSFTATATVDRKAVGVGKLPSFVIGRNLELAVTAKATTNP